MSEQKSLLPETFHLSLAPRIVVGVLISNLNPMPYVFHGPVVRPGVVQHVVMVKVGTTVCC